MHAWNVFHGKEALYKPVVILLTTTIVYSYSSCRLAVAAANAHWSFLVRQVAPETGATREAPLPRERMAYWSLQHHLTRYPFSTSRIILPKSSVGGAIIAFRLIVLSLRLSCCLMASGTDMHVGRISESRCTYVCVFPKFRGVSSRVVSGRFPDNDFN